MAVYENVLAKEFKSMMDSRRSINTSFSIMDMEVPELGLITDKDFVNRVGGRKAYIKGIAEPYFSDLNSSCSQCGYFEQGYQSVCKANRDKDVCPRRTVEIAKGSTFEKKVSINNNGSSSYRRDSRGNIMTNTITLEPGFVAVYSPVNIHLPNKIEKRGNMVPYTPTKGYSFIEAVETPRGKRYLYSVPKECVYPVELCALVISLNRHTAFYKGCKVALTNGHFVYLYSIPYKYKENKGYRVIGAKTNPNFDEEMNTLLDFWIKKEILFDLNLTALEDNYKGKNNLGIEDLPAPMSYTYDSYVKIKGALKELETEESEVPAEEDFS